MADTDEGQADDDEDSQFFEPTKGQELLAGLLQDNFDICQDIKAREGEENVARGPLQAIYDRLSEIKAQLERLVLTHRWTLRETVSEHAAVSRWRSSLRQAHRFANPMITQDLYNFQNELSRVDALRVDGKVDNLLSHLCGPCVSASVDSIGEKLLTVPLLYLLAMIDSFEIPRATFQRAKLQALIRSLRIPLLYR